MELVFVQNYILYSFYLLSLLFSWNNYLFILKKKSSNEKGNDELKNYTLDNLREYLGISKEGAHDALKDVKDTAQIMIRFLRLHRNLSSKIKFKEYFK